VEDDLALNGKKKKKKKKGKKRKKDKPTDVSVFESEEEEEPKQEYYLPAIKEEVDERNEDSLRLQTGLNSPDIDSKKQ